LEAANLGSIIEVAKSIILEREKTPEFYICKKCGAKSFRLWTDKKHTFLFCDKCMSAEHPLASIFNKLNIAKCLSPSAMIFDIFPAIPYGLNRYLSFLDFSVDELAWWFSLPENKSEDS